MQTLDPLMEGINQLRQLRVNFTVKNNRLRFHPKHIYNSLTEAQHLFIKQNRTAIKAAVQRGLPALARAATSAPPAAPKLVEPEPVMWDWDYTRRITAADVEAAGVWPGMSKQKAYERAREWLHEQQLAREEETHALMRHHAARDGERQGQPTRGVWEGLAYE